VFEMKVAKYYSQKEIRYEDAPVPLIGSAEVLVKMKACGVCGSDLMDWYLTDRVPLVLGHEPAGVIVDSGADVKNFREGDRVFVHHHVPCLTCHYCVRGAYTMCDQYRRTHIDPGGFAEYFRVPAPNVQIDTLKLPDSLSFEEATLIEPTACCIKALKKCNIRQGDTAVVVGAGPSGLLHTLLLQTLGVGRIIVSEPIEYRLKAAERFGADVVINPAKEGFREVVMKETGGRGGDVVIVTAPSIRAISSGFEACSRGGTICVFAPTSPNEYFPLSPNRVFFSEITVVSSYSTSHLETRTALKLIEAKRIKARELITHRFHLHETGKAFKVAIEEKESLKIIINSEN
jgi:L-iditol 2-dehydrogenase